MTYKKIVYIYIFSMIYNGGSSNNKIENYKICGAPQKLYFSERENKSRKYEFMCYCEFSSII